MDQKKRQAGKTGDLTRRDLMRTGAVAAAGLAVGNAQKAYAEIDVARTRSYNPEMKYRQLGKTGLWISEVCLGGHWKRVDKMVPGVFKGRGWLSADLNDPGFRKNRRDVVTRCIESGINYIDACTKQEILTYAEALRGRRDAMYLGFSWYQEELRFKDYRTAKALLGTLDKGMREAKLDYVDVWRVTMDEQSGDHTYREVDEMMAALEKAKQQGKVRFTGFSSHDRKHIRQMIMLFPDIVQVVCTPYTAKSKVLPKDSVFDAVKEYGVGVFGIKPFANNSLFRGDSSPDSPDAERDDRVAREAIRYILCNPAITAPIPGMINTHQVDNVVKAVKERRELAATEAKELEQAMDEAWARLPADYQWLKNWEYV
ncbi:MAG: aldo/keto reductase [Phycisphaerales bacterium]|nr:MAG: aldo/keto reductase [Phycisphaerales bacterium]